jgi:hypothetical protein
VIGRRRYEDDIPSNCFLLDLLCYLKLRLPTLNRYCVVLDEPHLFEPMLIPTVSCRDLAMYTFQTFSGWWNLAAADIAAQAEVVDLLVNMAKVAFASTRWDMLLGIIDGPNRLGVDALFPKITDQGHTVISPQNPDIEKLRQVAASFPSVRDIVASGDLKTTLDGCHPLAHTLFQWVITSNRTFIVRLPASKRIQEIPCTHQFLMKSATQAKEEKFQALKRLHPTCFAFHGSGMECWHSILRLGLKNVSNTKMMTAGAAHGSGVYCAPNMSTSVGYCRGLNAGPPVKAKGGRHADGSVFLTGQISVMAICELVDATINGKPTIKKSGGIWVVENDDHINTRFLLVWDESKDGRFVGASVDTVMLDAQIRAAAEQGAEILAE